MFLFHTLQQQVWTALMLTVSAFAWWRGGPPEKTVAAANVAAALRSDRYWPMWAAAFQLLAVITHGAMMADPTVGGWAYITGYIIWGYLVLAALGVGTWLLPRARHPAAPA